MRRQSNLQTTAYDTIINRIHSGDLLPETLYSETKLASELGISRTPLRDALHALVQDGYIEVIPSKGFMIRHLSEKDMIETIQLRCSIEGFCVQMIVSEISSKKYQTLIKKLSDCLSKMEKSMTMKNFPESFIKHDHAFHRLMIDYVNNETMKQLYRKSMYLIRLTSSATLSVPGRAAAILEEHHDVLNCLKKGDGDGAYRFLIAHLMFPMNMHMFPVDNPEQQQKKT